MIGILKVLCIAVFGFLLLVGLLTWSNSPSSGTSEPGVARIPTKADSIRQQFSAWDGSHINFKQFIKDNMNDPSSFEHVKTAYEIRKDSTEILIQMTYRGTNAFGGVVTNTSQGLANINGDIIKLIK